MVMVIAFSALVACGGGGARAYCDVIKKTIAESPTRDLPALRQVQILRELEHDAPDSLLRRDLVVYQSEAQLIATHPERVRSFPEDVSGAFNDLSNDAKGRCGADPFSPASADAPNAALTLTVPNP
jgi:hypothetical protein